MKITLKSNVPRGNGDPKIRIMFTCEELGDGLEDKGGLQLYGIFFLLKERNLKQMWETVKS